MFVEYAATDHISPCALIGQRLGNRPDDEVGAMVGSTLLATFEDRGGDRPNLFFGCLSDDGGGRGSAAGKVKGGGRGRGEARRGGA